MLVVLIKRHGNIGLLSTAISSDHVQLIEDVEFIAPMKRILYGGSAEHKPIMVSAHFRLERVVFNFGN